MNFLGHLFFSNNNPELMYANLQGDYIKGKDFSMYAEIVQEGVVLHRTIDNFIDTHPAVRELLHELYPHLPKISGIAVDLYFDHLLAKNWKQFHPMPLRQFIDEFYAFKPKFSDDFSPEFNFMLSKMKEFDWLYQYQFLDGLQKACTGLSRRISFENNLHEAATVYQKKEKEIERAFQLFMQDALPFYENYFKKN